MCMGVCSGQLAIESTILFVKVKQIYHKSLCVCVYVCM